ncbi:hypothetical protein FB451DRAFT_1571829, partial [Mycena latifolia]
MRAVSVPPRRRSALDEHPAAAKHRSIANTGPLLLGYGAGKEVHKAQILRVKSSSHSSKDAFRAFQSASLFTTILSSSGAISPVPIPLLGTAVKPSRPSPTRARDGSGEESAAKVAQPSALHSVPKVLKSRRRAKARPTLVFPRLHLCWCASHATPGYVHFPP